MTPNFPALSVTFLLLVSSGRVVASEVSGIADFADHYCTSCHDDAEAKGGLDLTALPYKPADPSNFKKWLKIYDRVKSGEMPPKKKPRPDGADLEGFLEGLSGSLSNTERQSYASQGRTTKRRLNRYEYEETLRDLLSTPFLDVKNSLPEDTEAFGFNKVGDALDVSHVQMARYLAAADLALRQATAPAVSKPQQTVKRYHTWDQDEFISNFNQNPPLRRTFPLQGLTLKPEFTGKGVRDISKLPQQVREAGAAGIVMSTYEPTYIRFGKFKAPVAGRYMLRLSASTFWMNHQLNSVSAGHRPEPVTLYADTPPDRLRKLASFDVGPDPTVREVEVWLQKGETIRPDAARLFRPRPLGHQNPLEESDGMPGVAFQWLEVDGPVIALWPPAGHRLMFGDLPMKAGTGETPVEVVSNDPDRDASCLLRDFMAKACNRPVVEAEKPIYISTKRSISRRRFLRGAGIAMSLPLLESMIPAFASSTAQENKPRRMLGICNNLGLLPDQFFPTNSGRDYQLSPYLNILSGHRNDMTVFSGVSHPDVDGGHPADICFLTAAPHPGSGGFRNTISLDQYISERIGHLTRYQSLTLGVNVQQGRRSLSWTGSGVLIPCEERASNVYRQLFLQGSKSEMEQQARKLRLGQSILDTVAGQAKDLERGLGGRDRDRIDQYFTSVRELEKRMAMSREWENKPKPAITEPMPTDPASPAEYMEKVRMMYDMARLAFETDSTRSVTLMLDSLSSPAIQVDGTKITDGYHNLSHHGKTEAKLSQLKAIDQSHMKLLDNLFTELKSVKENGEPLLDRTIILYGSNLGNANTHVTTNLPVLIAGGGFKHGQHLAFDTDRNYPLPNLFVSMLQRMGIESGAFASSTGTMRGLETAS